MGWTTHAYGPTSIAMGYQTNAL
ncbi:TPA: hypothetical protein DCZ39_02235 [Patescibacteria group bacterium]|nr:hypothetical protein [Candidatus Gracilibacteria bacterium]